MLKQLIQIILLRRVFVSENSLETKTKKGKVGLMVTLAIFICAIYFIAKRVSNGSFVPKHTYDVFSKLISEKMTPELNVWNETDIQKHEEWIKTRVSAIKKTIKK